MTTDSINIPKKITPDPIIDSVVEIRFTSELESKIILSKLIDLFKKDFPDVELSGIPKQLNPNIVDIKLSNELFIIGIGSNVITFSCVKPYKGWASFSKQIFSSLQKILAENIVKTIDRIGIRYINFFAGEFNISENMRFNVDYNGISSYKTIQSTFITEIEKDGFTHLLRVSDSSKIGGKTGGLIDIDTSINQIQLTNNEELFAKINDGRHEEKLIFFRLLKDDFINKFNPEY